MAEQETDAKQGEKPDPAAKVRLRNVGDYELVGDAPVGTGAQGVVWLARRVGPDLESTKTGDVVALKILKPGAGDIEKYRQRFQRLCVLRHPNIVQYKEVFIHPDGQRCCIAMEYVDGDSLDKLIAAHREHGLPWEQARKIIFESLDAFNYAAGKGVIHRDIKPANIRVNAQGQVKVIDFEIARRAEGGSTIATIAGGFAGTFAYMAPEFATDGFKGDEVSDLFSAGVCFAETASGALPFDRFESDRQGIEFMKRWVVPEKWPKPTFEHLHLPASTDQVAAFLTKMVSPAREQRYQRFAQALAEFRRFLPRVIGEAGGERYEFDEVADLLGKGGFGAVFRGRRLSDGLQVAIKQLHAQKYLQRFARERKILQRINHPNIVKFLDFVELESHGQHEYFIIMEFLEGMPDYSLRRRIKHAGGPLPVAESIAMFQSYLAAVQHLHESGVIHRDLTPNNLYSPPDRPHDAKVIDLGVAMDESGTMTVGGGLPGVPDYMAPEFATRNNVRGSPQTDLFSIGICFYEALVGRRPFPTLPSDPKRQWAEWIRRCQKLPAIDFGATAFRTNPPLRRIVAKILAAEPEDRYASATDMARDLEGALAPSEEDEVATQMYEGPMPTAEEAQAGEIKTVFAPLERVQEQLAPAAREAAPGRKPPGKAEAAAPPPKAPAPVVEFSADATTIPKNGRTVIRWKIERANAATLDGQRIELAGEREVHPAAKTRYRLVAEGPGGSVEREVVVGIAINWKPVILSASAAAAAAIVAMGGMYWWNNRQIGYADWQASVPSVNGLVQTLKAGKPNQTKQLRGEAASRFAAAFAAGVDQKLAGGERAEAIALVEQWQEVSGILAANEMKPDAGVAASLHKKLAESYVATFAGLAARTNAAGAQSLLLEWNSITGRFGSVASFDPAIAADMQKQLSGFRASQEATDLLREVRVAASFDEIGAAIAKYKVYRDKSGANAGIEAQAVATITGLVASATANFTTRPAGLDGFEKAVGGFVDQKLLPQTARTQLAEAGARIDANLKDRERLQRFRKLSDALVAASSAAELDPLRRQIVESSWSADQSSLLVELLSSRSAVAINALVPGEAVVDAQKLAEAQAALRRLPDWMQKFDQFRIVDQTVASRIESSKMAAQKQSQIAKLRAAIPPPPATSDPRAYAAFARAVDAVVGEATKDRLYPTIAAEISAATNAAAVQFGKSFLEIVGAWQSQERPVALSNWISSARTALAAEPPAWARDALARATEQAVVEIRRTEIVVANDSKGAVELRWPAEMSRPPLAVGAGVRTNVMILADYPVAIQAAADPSVPFASRRKTAAFTASPGRRNSLAIGEGQFPVLPTTVTWAGPSKELAGLKLQVDGADFASGQSKPFAPDSKLKLTWKRADHQDVQVAGTVAAAEKMDLSQFLPAADKWLPSEDFTLARKFVALVEKQDTEAAAEIAAGVRKATIQDEGLRASVAAAMKQMEQAFAGRAEAALHAADRVRASLYLYTANSFTREGRLSAAAARLEALQKKVVPLMRGASDPRQQMWLGLAEKGAKLAAADVQNALKQVPASSEQDADRIVLTYLLDGAAAASALPQAHPEYQRYWFHTSRLAEFLAEDVEATRIEETADLALGFLPSPPKSIVIEPDDVAAVDAFLKAAGPVAEQQAAWTGARERLKKLQVAVAALAGKLK